MFDRFPDAAQVDANNGTIKEISFNHATARHLLHSWHEAALAQLAAVDAACIHSVQPTFNNEVEIKYTQVRTLCSPACLPACLPSALSAACLWPAGLPAGKRRQLRGAWRCSACMRSKDGLGSQRSTLTQCPPASLLALQTADAPRDYSPRAVKLFQDYFQSVEGSVTHWNQRWGTDFGSWSDVQPPLFFQHLHHFNDTATDLFYWDFQHFRHQRIHAAHEGACMHIAAHGFRCILHFPEFLTSTDAIYASASVFTLAASPWLDYVVLDSNFMTTSMHPNDVRVVTLLVAAMKPFGKPVFFEGAFERISDPALHQRAVSLTVAAGTHGMGFTNWLDRIGPEFFGTALHGSYGSRSADAPAIAILTPYRSYWAYKGARGLADGVTLSPKDAQQDLLFQCLDKVEAAVPSLEGLQIFAVPAMLLSVLHDFQQVWYLEPDVLLSGDAKTVDAARERAAELGAAFQNCLTRQTAPIVLPECCPA